MGVFQYEKVKDPTYYGENRVAAHSDHRYYGSVEEMEQHVENFRHSLNGLWKFHYAKNILTKLKLFNKFENYVQNYANRGGNCHVLRHVDFINNTQNMLTHLDLLRINGRILL